MARNGTSDYVSLERRLVLLGWLNSRLGYRNNREMLAECASAAEGFDADGRSFAFHHLLSRGSKVTLPRETLARYDDNIREHLARINECRGRPLTLRSFQYMTALYAEIFLDACFNARKEFLRSLEKFADSLGNNRPAGLSFTESDLKKAAFWMATGSGKTLIMHLNYRQFLRYNNEPLDNILLITPNESLSEQHLEEMTASNIPCRAFSPDESGLTLTEPNTVRVIEITKLVEEKRGGGASVPVEAFEGNNLVFVDEGHKGAGGEAWRSFRDALGETGFTFEYSATFGQALTAAKNDELTAEYGKSIVFDYSYRYFHGDGYGKDFRILNMKEEANEELTGRLLTGSLLSFYERRRLYETEREAFRPYNIEQPLWIFVGSSVNVVYTENGEKRSDVLTIVRFLHRLLENKDGATVRTIRAILDGTSGLTDPDGSDLFAGRFDHLRKSGLNAEIIFRDIGAKIFRTSTEGGLRIVDLRGAAGELGLKAAGAEEHFGVISIGDTASFKKLVEADDSGVLLEEDVVTDSLFDGINEPDSTISVLIGAKKFIEGWNSWRVSNMGLLNIGRKEGSAIIQLFGRGVRLKGRDFSLKRSASLEGPHPEGLSALETLDIFAVRANYMSQFREYLEREGVGTEGYVEIPLPILRNDRFLAKGLLVPRIPEETVFADETTLVLEPDFDVSVRADLSVTVQALDGAGSALESRMLAVGTERTLPPESLALVDWESVRLDLIEHKERQGMRNLVVLPDAPRAILGANGASRLYTLVAEESVVRPRTFAETKRLNEAVTVILRKYMDAFYLSRRKRWESSRMVYKPLDGDDANFRDYTMKVPREKADLIESVRAIIAEADHLYKQDLCDLPSVHFDRHLYQPLLKGRNDDVRSEPPGLNAGELRFVKDLREYCLQRKSADGAELFLLRNLSRGRGVGFFKDSGFYPDFILWIRNGETQRIVFVEPHGMLYALSYTHDCKARLHEALPALAAEIERRTGRRNVTLDSFIVSATPFEDLRRSYDDGSWDRDRFARAHILFPERTPAYDYIGMIVEG